MTEEPKYLRKGCSVAAITRLAQNEVNAPLIETREQARSTHLSTAQYTVESLSVLALPRHGGRLFYAVMPAAAFRIPTGQLCRAHRAVRRRAFHARSV